MGIDLRLFPIDHITYDDKDGHPWGYSHTVIQLHRDYELHERIRALNPRQLPVMHDISALLGTRVRDGYHEGEPTYGKLTTDAYAQQYTWLTAAELALAFDAETGPAATVAYVRALPPDTLIVLDWC